VCLSFSDVRFCARYSAISTFPWEPHRRHLTFNLRITNGTPDFIFNMSFDAWTNRRIAIPLLILLAIIWTYKLAHPTLKLPSYSFRRPVDPESPNNLTYLSKIQLSSSFTYARRTIKTEHYNGERPDNTTMKETLLFPEAQRLNRNTLVDVETANLPPLTFSIPLSPHVDTSM